MRTMIRLDADYRFMENDYGVFLQKIRKSKRYAVGLPRGRWRTVKMFKDLQSAFKAWEDQNF